MKILSFYWGSQLLTWPLYLLPQLCAKRRGLLPKRLRPPRLSSHKPLLWVHALSVGETRAAYPLIRALKEVLPDFFLFFTVTTSAGFKLAQKELASLVDQLWSLPLDLWPSVKFFVRRLEPQVFVLVETDLWPGLLWELRASRTKTFFVNAALSTKAQRRLARFKKLSEFLYGPFDFIGAATKGDAQRLQTILSGSKVSFLGNLKFDVPPPCLEEAEPLIKELAPFLKPPVIVCGSTHPGEEELWLKAFRKFGRGSLVICPRKIDRVPEVLDLARKMGLTTALRSDPKACQVLVVDTMGELKNLYALADLSFVGGSLVPVGGHNLLEPALWGKPVLFGPFVESVADLAQELSQKRGGFFLKPEVENLLETLQKILPHRKEFGMEALKVARLYGGAAHRYAKIIADHLRSPSND